MKDIYLNYSSSTQVYPYYEGKRRHNHHEYHDIKDVYNFLKNNVKNKSNVCLNVSSLEKKLLDELKTEIHKTLPKIKIEEI